MSRSTKSQMRRALLVASLALGATSLGFASNAEAFTPGTGCGTGTGSAAGITATASFTALPPCAGYIRVAMTCKAFSGANGPQIYGPIKTWPNSSSKTCVSPYNASIAGWGWQVSGTP